MYVDMIGNVTECNSSYIHLNNEGRQESIKATVEKLQDVLRVASENVVFYKRMYDEIYALYQKLTDEAVARNSYITDEDIAEARDSGNKDWLMMKWGQDSHNLESTRNRCEALGTYNGCKYASNREMEARKLKSQAEAALQHLSLVNPNIKRAKITGG